MAWKGISESVDALGRMRVRVRMATAQIAVQGALVIKLRAQFNILNRFKQHTGRLFNSMTSDPIAKALGPNDYTARAYPRGPASPMGTPYGRIQELGGTIHAHNPTGLLWFDSLQESGKWGIISVPEVTLEGRFYLRDAVIASEGELHNLSKRGWASAVEG